VKLQRHDAKQGFSKQGGFTLLELLLVVAILSIIIGAVFSQLNIAQQRLSTEETRLDDFQQARDFVDQFFRDINQIGTPNMQIMDTSSPASFSPALTAQTSYTYANAYINDSRMAMGLVKIDTSEIRFEGAMSGNGTVQTVIYKINGSGTCSLCMQRSQIDKTTADPLTQSTSTTNWGTEVNDVIIDSTKPIFRYFQYDGTEVVPPSGGLDYTTSTNAALLANVKTIQINLTIRNNNVTDKQTGMPIETSFEGEVSLNNCSMATTGQNMSCQ
jgi:prepilin-type N-terminal cleavage/methylation domain-containing protein